MIEKLMYRVNEFAEAIGVSRSKAYEMIARGEVPTVRVGGSVRVPVANVRKWIEANVSAAGAEKSAQG